MTRSAAQIAHSGLASAPVGTDATREFASRNNGIQALGVVRVQPKNRNATNRAVGVLP